MVVGLQLEGVGPRGVRWTPGRHPSGECTVTSHWVLPALLGATKRQGLQDRQGPGEDASGKEQAGAAESCLSFLYSAGGCIIHLDLCAGYVHTGMCSPMCTNTSKKPELWQVREVKLFDKRF